MRCPDAPDQLYAHMQRLADQQQKTATAAKNSMSQLEGAIKAIDAKQRKLDAQDQILATELQRTRSELYHTKDHLVAESARMDSGIRMTQTQPQTEPADSMSRDEYLVGKPTAFGSCTVWGGAGRNNLPPATFCTHLGSSLHIPKAI